MEDILSKMNINHNDLVVDSSWNEDMIIRYLYIKLAPYFKRDLKYFLGSPEERKRQYEMGFPFTGPNVTCKSISDYYSALYSNMGIKSKVITTNNKEIPHFALLVQGTGGWYYTDPLKDLLANQLGLKTCFFAMTPRPEFSTVKRDYPFLIELPEEQLKHIDISINLLKNDFYMDEFYSLIKKECMNSNNLVKLYGLGRSNKLKIMLTKVDFAVQHLINLGQVHGIYERKQYYEYIKYLLFNKGETDFINVYFDVDNGNYCVSLNIISSKSPEEIHKFTECFSASVGYSLYKR